MKKPKINCLTIVNQQGTKSFYVGSEYNGRTLTEIVDFSSEFPDNVFSNFIGRDSEGLEIFQTHNAPVVVEYESKGE